MDLLGSLLDVLVVPTLGLQVGERGRKVVLGRLARQGEGAEVFDKGYEKVWSLERRSHGDQFK